MNRGQIVILCVLPGLCGCQFDDSALAGRACGADADCAPGFICTEGYCLAGGRVGPAPDVGSTPDVSPPLDASEPDVQACIPEPEICNGEDDDCDGVADNDVAPSPCQVGVGVCQRDGETVCANAVESCGTPQGPAGQEVCNGLDDDCDGIVDEAEDGGPLQEICYPGAPAELDFGCEQGMQICNEGAWGACEGAVTPAVEVCNGLDDDCDGRVDEGCGCADGEREAYLDAAQWPDIAGCAGEWPDQPSLRDPATEGDVCGDDTGEPCRVPADLCGNGWRVCGVEMNIHQLRAALGGGAGCTNAGAGRWVVAASHCRDDGWPWCRTQDNPSCYPGGSCSEPICCGFDCTSAGCNDSVFESATRIPASASNGCGEMPDSNVSGVLCCRIEAIEE
jgi:hypothetical protein